MANSQIFRGGTFKGVINLKQDDGCSADNITPYVINPAWILEVHFPQDTTLPTPVPVVLSSANPGEVTILNASLGQFAYQGAPSKSLLMGVGKNLSIDVKVIKAVDDEDIFQRQKTLDVLDPDNL